MIEKSKTLASNQEWDAWGKLDPLYGVATIPERSKTGANPWTDDSFYAAGEKDWALFRAKWEQYGFTPGVCVEIGCGAGRMTVHLARSFERVHGMDVSFGMVEYARRHAPDNVSFHVTGGGEIPLPDGTVDAAFSTHVFQHLSTRQAAAAYFAEIGRVLRPGGAVMIHIPVIMWPWGSLRGLHKAIHRIKLLLDRTHAQLARYAFRLKLTSTPPMQVTSYEIAWLHRTLKQCGLEDFEIQVLIGGSEMSTQHPFVFARKAH